MAQTVGLEGAMAMLKGAAARIRANHEHLTKLDSATGDGDHGSAMLRVAAAIESTIGSAVEKGAGDVKALLHDVGWAVMAVPGGSTGPLYGSLIVGMSEGLSDDAGAAVDSVGVASMLESGLAKLGKSTKAKEGDKTMVDALAPAVRAAREAADAGKGIAEALSAAAAAAAKGAEATKGMKAKFGRARNLGDRVIGHADPGATSITYVLEGLAEGAGA